MLKTAGILCAAILAAAAFTSIADARHAGWSGGGSRMGGAGFSGAI